MSIRDYDEDYVAQLWIRARGRCGLLSGGHLSPTMTIRDRAPGQLQLAEQETIGAHMVKALGVTPLAWCEGLGAMIDEPCLLTI
jgi:hypothetical protein